MGETPDIKISGSMAFCRAPRQQSVADYAFTDTPPGPEHDRLNSRMEDQETNMSKVRQLTAVIEREGNGYVSSCPELDIVSQGKTIEDARLNLVEAVEGFFEVASASEIRRRLKKETYIMPIMPTMPAVSMRQTARLAHA